MRRTSKFSIAAACLAAFSMIFGGVGLADVIELSASSVTLAPGAASSFVVYLQATDDPTDLIDGCNAGNTNQTQVAVKFTSTNTNVVATPPNVNLTGCDNPATPAIENGQTVNYTVLALALDGASTTITAAALNNQQGIRIGTPPTAGTFASADALVVTVDADPCSGRTAPGAPTISTAGTPAGTGWFNAASAAGDEAFSITPSADAEYSVNGGTWTAYSGPVTLGDGDHSVVARNFLPATTTPACARVDGVESDAEAIKIDRTAPDATPASVNDTTWRNTPLSETYTFSDATSGLASNQGLNGSDQKTLTASTESANSATPTTDSVTIYDVAGNSVSRSVTALIDLTAPAVSILSVSPSLPNGDNDWYKTAVAVTFRGTDTLSGFAPSGDMTKDELVNSTGDGAAVSVSSPAFSDRAGNTTAAGDKSQSFKIDTTAPTSSVSGISAQSYTLGNVPTPTCVGSDALSGIASGFDGTLSGFGTGIGSHTVTCNGAKDNAGNVQTAASAGVTYNVIYNFTGFFAPVDNLPTRNTVKAGRAIPVKFKLGGFQGLDIFGGPGSLHPNTAKAPASWSITCGSSLNDALETTVTAGSSSLSYDAGTQTYNYVWKTDSAWAGKCRTFELNLNDGSSHTFTIQSLK